MEARKPNFCCLSARGIIPPLPQEDIDDDAADITPTEVEVVEISDEEEEDMVELSFEEYMRNMGYLIRVEESVEDIEPEFRRMLKRMEQEEKKLTEEKFKVLNSGIKLEVGQSSKGDGEQKPKWKQENRLFVASQQGIIPPLPQEDTDDDVADSTPTEVEVVEISNEKEEEDMVELSFEEYRRNMGYLIRVE
ncbi:hypothetical protein F2Q69_00033689 [Brassica cretica]|uniref:Uncharacterized protein n=1 Tax=Brassica cretica TaxID=69181 RepID=A0A8S9SDT9_BRACR|nr:hypothetical protein F2Q69_00033689 [Brassica cretica]